MIIKNDTESHSAAVIGVSISYELKNEVLSSIPDPLVSVYVPTYEHKNFIEECIESILMQKTDFPFEIIIGEDFSTDGTREIVINYAEKYPERIRVITADSNIKQLANRVRCLKALRGKYIAQCDGDDYWTDPLKLQKQADFMQNHSQFSLCYHSYQILDEAHLSKSQSLGTRDFSGDELVGFPTGIAVSTKFFRNVYRNLEDYWLYEFAGDASCTALLGTFGRGKFLSDIKPSIYRKHGNSEWNSKDVRFKYHTGKYVRMKIYKKFLNAGDERSAMLCLAAIRQNLMRDPKIVTPDQKAFNISRREFKVTYRDVWFQFYYYPLFSKIRKKIRFLLNKKV